MREEYEQIRKRLNIKSKDFSLISPHLHIGITLDIINAFTDLGALGLHKWWWESFKKPTWSIGGCDNKWILSKVLNPNKKYYLIAESWLKNKRESDFWIYDVNGNAVIDIISNTHPHEYYLCNKKMNFLICRNHHNVHIGVGDIIKPAQQTDTAEPVSDLNR